MYQTLNYSIILHDCHLLQMLNQATGWWKPILKEHTRNGVALPKRDKLKVCVNVSFVSIFHLFLCSIYRLLFGLELSGRNIFPGADEFAFSGKFGIKFTCTPKAQLVLFIKAV